MNVVVVAVIPSRRILDITATSGISMVTKLLLQIKYSNVILSKNVGVDPNVIFKPKLSVNMLCLSIGKLLYTKYIYIITVLHYYH